MIVDCFLREGEDIQSKYTSICAKKHEREICFYYDLNDSIFIMDNDYKEKTERIAFLRGLQFEKKSGYYEYVKLKTGYGIEDFCRDAGLRVIDEK